MFNPPTWVHTPHLGKVIVPDRHMCRASIIADGFTRYGENGTTHARMTADGITYLNENEIARAIINDIGFGHFDPNGNLVWVSPRR